MTGELDATFYTGVVLCIVGAFACLAAGALAHWVYAMGIRRGIALERRRAIQEIERRYPKNVVSIRREGR
jgi:hypothetical protein